MKSLSVKQFNQYVKTSFKYDPLFQNISIEGEISNFKISHDHIFFSLKEDNDIVDCAIFFYNDKSLEKLYDGQLVKVYGNVVYSTYSSKITISIKEVKLSGLSDEYLEFLKLKNEFYKKGYFDLEIKKDIKEYPRKVGLITSDKSAAIMDFVSVINKEVQDMEIYLYSVKVQGNNAKDEIILGLEKLDGMNLDCIVITRGGGSKEDLKVFNEKDLIEKIYNLKTPVISAIGHKIDSTLVDLVSDISLQTPTEAGLYLVRNYTIIREKIEDIYTEIKKTFLRNLEVKQMEISYFKSRLDLLNPKNLVNIKKKDLDLIYENIKKIVKDNINDKVNLVDKLGMKISSIKEILEIKSKSIAIKSLDNKNIYSKFTLKNEDFIKIVFSDGEVKVQVKDEW